LRESRFLDLLETLVVKILDGIVGDEPRALQAGGRGSSPLTSTNTFRFQRNTWDRPTYARQKQWLVSSELADQCPNLGAHFNQFGGRYRPFIEAQVEK